MLAFHQLTSICVEVPVCEDMCVSTFLPLGTADGKVSAPVAQTVKRLPTVWEARQSLGLEDPLEKEMATPVLLPGKSHGRRSVVGCGPWGRKESDTTERRHFYCRSRSALLCAWPGSPRLGWSLCSFPFKSLTAGPGCRKGSSLHRDGTEAPGD